MTAQFPNVPDVPGVPAVARAAAQLQSVLSGSANAVNGANDALDRINLSDFVGATSSLNSTISSAQGALTTADTIFSASSDAVGGLSGTVANASNALDAIASGDISGAIASTEQAIDTATRAYNAVNTLLNPTAQDPLGSSGEEVNADTAAQWGLFTQDGDPAAPADNVIAFENSLEARISDYPVAPNTGDTPSQTVGFGSYNKVIVPYDVRLIMSRGGSVEDRQDFLQAIQDAWQSTDLFNVVTPECVYLDVNVVGVRRMAASDRGMGLMTLEIALRKVRQTATLTFTQTKEATGSGQVNGGSVQAQPVPASSPAYAGSAA